MGRWLASLCSEEKNTEMPLDRTDKTDKTSPDRVLSVLSVPSSGISEKFLAQATVRRPLPQEPSKASKPPFVSFVSDQGSHISGIERQEAAVENTANTPAPTYGAWPEPKITGNPPFGADHVPSRYEAKWRDLLAGCPSWATEWQWAETIFSCRDLFGEWGAELLRLNWQQKDIFDRWHGLGWFLRGRKVTALGLRHAFIEDGRIFERLCR